MVYKGLSVIKDDFGCLCVRQNDKFIVQLYNWCKQHHRIFSLQPSSSRIAEISWIPTARSLIMPKGASQSLQLKRQISSYDS